MMSEERIIWPQLPATLHADVTAECRLAYQGGRPWTPIRELRKGVDDPSGHKCNGSLGAHHIDCKKKLEGVQYTSAFGDPVYYCEEHALLQNDWDKNLYDSKPKPRVMTPEWEAEIAKMMFKIEKKKRKKEQAEEEIDPS
jgi:hypothetical protein